MSCKTTSGDPQCANKARKDSFPECIGWHPASRVANTFGHITTIQQISFGLPATKLCRLGLRHGDPNTDALPVVNRITPMVMCRPHPSRPIKRCGRPSRQQLQKANQQHVLAIPTRERARITYFPLGTDPVNQTHNKSGHTRHLRVDRYIRNSVQIQRV